MVWNFKKVYKIATSISLNSFFFWFFYCYYSLSLYVYICMLIRHGGRVVCEGACAEIREQLSGVTSPSSMNTDLCSSDLVTITFSYWAILPSRPLSNESPYSLRTEVTLIKPHLFCTHRLTHRGTRVWRMLRVRSSHSAHGTDEQRNLETQRGFFWSHG